MIPKVAEWLCVLALAIAVNATDVAEASEKIAPQLQKELGALGPDEDVAVIIDFLGGVDVEQYGDAQAGKRRSELIKALKAEADRIQRPVASMLESRGVTSAKQLWLSNKMAVTVPAAMVDELALQPGVERIKLDVVTPLTHRTAEAAEPRAARPDTVTETANRTAGEPAATGLSPPLRPRSTAITQTTVRLEWDAPIEDVGKASYRLYELVRINRFRSEWRPKIEGISRLWVVSTDLEPGSKHEYAIVAVDEEGRESERSVSVAVATLRPPIAYHPIHRSDQPVAAIVSEVFRYKVNALGVPPPTFMLAAGPDTMEVDPVSGVVHWMADAGDEGTVTATVRASNSEGSDDHTFAIAVHPAGSDLQAPSSVRMVVTRDTTAHGATLKWKPATDNVAVVGYRVLAQRFGRGNSLFLAGHGLAPATSVTLTTLEPKTGYRLWVQPYDAAGNAATISGVPPAHIKTLPGPSESALQSTDP